MGACWSPRSKPHTWEGKFSLVGSRGLWKGCSGTSSGRQAWMWGTSGLALSLELSSLHTWHWGQGLTVGPQQAAKSLGEAGWLLGSCPALQSSGHCSSRPSPPTWHRNPGEGLRLAQCVHLDVPESLTHGTLQVPAIQGHVLVRSTRSGALHVDPPLILALPETGSL